MSKYINQVSFFYKLPSSLSYSSHTHQKKNDQESIKKETKNWRQGLIPGSKEPCPVGFGAASIFRSPAGLVWVADGWSKWEVGRVLPVARRNACPISCSIFCSLDPIQLERNATVKCQPKNSQTHLLQRLDIVIKASSCTEERLGPNQTYMAKGQDSESPLPVGN